MDAVEPEGLPHLVDLLTKVSMTHSEGSSG
jgi:hypothetical protein